ncbi:MAG: hypothetical protein CVV23_08415 [Ignavibacteriae bacterium HGW-Ignavibacteriae-2]|jgi:heat shock protein HspQ|nr:MAG: hypothetical protein CVV23_08415 [Ignavibacteriae bacterium HGW-Ignavibacteriae-2]
MKRFIFMTLISAFLAGDIYGQNVIPVLSKQNSIYDALLNAKDGDVLELIESGEYLLDSLLYIDKTITVKAAEELKTKPIIKFDNPSIGTRFLFEIKTGGNLTLEGLDLNGASGSGVQAKYLIKTASSIVGSYKLFVNDCILRDVNTGDENGNFFIAYADTYADSVIFNDCLLYNSGREGIRLKEVDNQVNYFEISNSTMFNTGHEGIYVQGNNVIFRVNHCTFDNLGYMHHDMVRPRFITDSQIKNTIFSNVPEPQTRALLIYGASIVDYCDFYNVGAIDIHDTSVFDFGENVLFNVDPQYADRENGNFTILESSPLYNYAENGGPIGDPKAAQKKLFIPKIHKVGLAHNELYDSLKVAKNGDVLELTQSGEYLLDSLLIIDKTISIVASQDLLSKPIIKNNNPNLSTRYIFEIQTGGNLFLKGLDIDGMADTETPAKYLIKTASSVSGKYKLIVDDCILRDVVSGSDGNFFRAYGDTFADSVKFTNCVLYNCGKEGIRIKDADNTVKYFEISNSTMYNTKSEAIYVQGDKVKFRINHCTFDNLGYNKTNMIRPSYILDAEIKNSIFSNTPVPHSTSIVIYGSSVIDYCDFYNVGLIIVNDPANFQMGENVLFEVDPQYADHANADFTLLGTSALYNIADDGKALGDLRWATNTPNTDLNVIHVTAARNSIYEALVKANSGDIIELTESGDYLLDSLLYVDKTITVRAAEGLSTKPVLKNVNPLATTRFLFEIKTGGNLYLKGLDLDGISSTSTPAKYLLKSAEQVDGLYNLFVDDCILHDVYPDNSNGNFFRGYSKAFADTVMFTNCIMYNSGKEGIRIKDADNTVKYFEISNSTMYDTNTEGIYIQGNEVVFKVNHCTFNNLGRLRAEMIRPRYVVNAEIKNSIFSNTIEPHNRTILIYGASVIDYTNFYNVGSISIHDSSAFRMGAYVVFDVDPMYADVSTGDFTLLEGSTMYNSADDGEALGDLRWAVNKPTTAVNTDETIPTEFNLDQNYPNPFNPTTQIKVSIPSAGNYKLTVYNILGESVTSLIDGYEKAGIYTVDFNASNLSSGIYFYNFSGNNFSQTKKMLLLK